MVRRGVLTDEQLGPDLPVTEASRDQPQDLPLALGQPVRQARRRRRNPERPDPTKEGPQSDPARELVRLAEQLEVSSEGVKALEEINADEGVRWLFSFLSADRRQSYCLYEAPSPDELIAAARRANIPADVIVEVNRIAPDMAV